MGAAGNGRAGRVSQASRCSRKSVPQRNAPKNPNARQEKKEELKKSLFEEDDSDDADDYVGSWIFLNHQCKLYKRLILV